MGTQEGYNFKGTTAGNKSNHTNIQAFSQVFDSIEHSFILSRLITRERHCSPASYMSVILRVRPRKAGAVRSLTGREGAESWGSKVA